MNLISFINPIRGAVSLLAYGAISLHASAVDMPVKRVLFFSKSSSFEHSVIRQIDGKPSHVDQVLAELGKANDIEFTSTKDGRVFTKEGLAPYDAVFFYTTGDLTKPGNDGQPPMPANGKQVLLDFIASGKGFIGTHSATDTFHSEGERFENNDTCDHYISMLGGEFVTHGSQQSATLKVVSPKFPGMAAVGDRMTLVEEWYALKNFPSDLHVLMVQETATMTGNQKGNPYDRPPFPSTWTRMHGKGRVFYTSLGHKPGTWTNLVFQSILIGGLNWATGRIDADVTPNLKEVTPGYAKLAPPSKTKAEMVDEESEEAPKVRPRAALTGGAATASGFQAGNRPNPPENAIDGNPTTYWAAKSTEFPQWLQIDLGKLQKLETSRIEWTSPKFAILYRIEGSSDGEKWKVLTDGTKNVRKGSVEDPLSGAEARYLRVTLIGTAGTEPVKIRPGIAEWKVDGKAVAATKSEAKPIAATNADDEQTLLAETTVPEGFEKTIFAAPPTINYPTFIATTPDGTVFVSCDKNGAGGKKPNQGRIVRLRDTDGDGRADEAKNFVPDINTPRGLIWDQDRLYVMHPPNLSVFIDKDGDGVADEEKVLVKNIGWGFKDRSGDHASDGIELGIDGWIYGSIGDFGFFDAEGADGKKLRMRGGGVIRVRPDGSGLEVYSHGTRNVYAVAVDPLLNVFGRDNNNDGSWGVLLHHFSGMDERGYPSLFLNFPEDIVPPLADYVTGSGSGATFIDEPGIPKKYSGLVTCDWGKSFAYLHPLQPSGATFKATQEEFIGASRMIDLKVDAKSDIFIASWRGAIFNYSGENVGYIAKISPKGYKAPALPNFEKASPQDLVKLLGSPSHRIRLESQRALLRRGNMTTIAGQLVDLAKDAKQSPASRVAAIFTLKQGLGAEAYSSLAGLAKDDALRPFVNRAIADRTDQLSGVPVELLVNGLKDDQPRTRLESVRALARVGDRKNAAAATGVLGDSDPIVAHTAVKALVSLKATDECFTLLNDPKTSMASYHGALQVLRSLHETSVVDRLIANLGSEKDVQRRRALLTALCRLHFVEGEWKGSGWGLAPDTTGPYFQIETWEQTAKIAAVLKQAVISAKGDEAAYLVGELNRHQIHMEEAVQSILGLALQDPKHIPSAVAMLARGTSVPPAGIPILIQAARDQKATESVRADAVVALARTDSREGCIASLSVLADFEKKPRGERLRSRPFKKAKEAFFTSKNLSLQTDALITEAKKSDAEISPWAGAALLKAAATSSQAKNYLDELWKTPEGKVLVLRSIEVGMDRGSKEQVLTALNDQNASVVAAAKATARALKLDPKAKPAALVGTLKPEAVIRTMAKMKGDPELGEQLFTQQSCVTCHTVQSGEPLRAGPYLGGTAGVYRADELAEMILNPSNSLAQGYEPHSVTTKSGQVHLGFIDSADNDKIVIRDMAMNKTEIATKDVAKNEMLEMSLMPPGLADSLTEKEFAALLAYLESLTKH